MHSLGDHLDQAARRQRQAVQVSQGDDTTGKLRELHLEDPGHLTVSIVFKDVHTLVPRNEIASDVVRRQRPQPQIVELDALLAQAVAGFDNGMVGGAVGDQPELRTFCPVDDGLGHEVTRGVELAVQALHVLNPVFGLAVDSTLVMPGAAREAGGEPVIGPCGCGRRCRRRQRPLAAEPAQLPGSSAVSTLPRSINRGTERLTHPQFMPRSRSLARTRASGDVRRVKDTPAEFSTL